MAANPHFPESETEYEKATLIEPADSGYILIAAVVDQRLPFLPPSRAKRSLLNDCGILCRAFERKAQVTSAAVFSALLTPPGSRRLLRKRSKPRPVVFDVVILIEATSMQTARDLVKSEAFTYLAGLVRGAAGSFSILVAENARRIAPVDHGNAGVFLFDYLHADDANQAMELWERAAGWLQEETGLDNATLLRPVTGSKSVCSLINHCRWDGLLDVVPSLLLKPSFRSYVLKTFEAGNVVSKPVLYRLA